MIEAGEAICQHIPGGAVDAAVGQRLIETLTPMNLDVALAVEQELQTRLDEADALRQQQVERARYEAELARRRYLRVDPWKRIGMRSYGACKPLRKRMNVTGTPTDGYSIRSTRLLYVRSRVIFRAYGITQRRPLGNASA